MVAKIQEKLGFRTTLVSNIQGALQDEQDELERGATLPWFLLQEDQTFTITPASPAVATPQQYTLPAGFISEADDADGNLRLQIQTPGPQTFIEKMDYREAEEFFFASRKVWWDGTEIVTQSTQAPPTPGQPKIYVLRKTQVRIYPGPDKVYNLLWTYYVHDIRLDVGNITNQWSTNIPWLLIGRAGLKMAMSTRDKDAATAFQQILAGSPGFAGAEKTYLALLYDRELGGRRYSMGRKL
jgi:hypothetical protein